jgi:hypothetical protein
MELALLAFLIALQVADYLTTRRILALGGYERNPIVRWFMSRLGERDGLIIAKLTMTSLALGSTALMGGVALWPLAALCALYCYVVWGNWRVIARLK